MIGSHLRRGLVAGLLAGLLAGVVGLVVAEPSIDAAITLEEAAMEEGALGVTEPGSDGTEQVSPIGRTQQKVGLVVGAVLLGCGIGALFGLAAAWARGRLPGTAWQRSLLLGWALALGTVVLPWFAYPPNPPAVGDPATVATRSALYLGTVLAGLLLAGLAWSTAAALRDHGWSPARRQALTGLVVGGLAATLLAVLPEAGGAGGFPADLLWRFRLGALATQLTLVGGLAVIFGLLDDRADPAPSANPTPHPQRKAPR